MAFLMGSPLTGSVRAKKKKGGKAMKRLDKTVPTIVNGDNNHIHYEQKTCSHCPKLVVAIILFIVAAVLAVSHWCPEKLSDFIQIVSSLVGIS